jgi:CheY-like chemotaxis protein
MDLVMPRMDGFEATKKLHSIVKEKSKSLPLVYAFTVDETDLNAGELLSRGFSGYITKPINLDQLNTIIKQYEDIGSNHGRKRDNTYETEAFL